MALMIFGAAAAVVVLLCIVLVAVAWKLPRVEEGSDAE